MELKHGEFTSIENKILNAIKDSLGACPDHIFIDDRYHHFYTGSYDKENKSGWYIFTGSADFIYGAFGDFRTNERHSFSSKSFNVMTYTEQFEYEQKRKKIEKKIAAQRADMAKKAALKAAEIMDSIEQGATHEYIERKQIKMLGGAGVKGDTLYVPAYNKDMLLVNVERITLDGKKPLYGGERIGTFAMIGTPAEGETILLAEGYATACSINMATKKPVVAAFNAGNLPNVAAHFKAHPLIICADNDKNEIGLKKAKEAAKKHGNAKVVLCPVSSDFNDLHVAEGLKAVRDAIYPAPAAVETSDLPYRSNQLPFKVLGRHAKKCYYMPADGQIYDYSPASHTKPVLLALAPYDFWANAYPSDRGGISTDEAVSWLLQQSTRVSFNIKSVRGRGAWVDDGRLIVHQGHSIYDVSSGKECDLEQFETDFIYPRSSSIAAKKVTALSDEGAASIRRIFSLIPTETRLQANMLAGWIVCSQISGVLSWRPHIWMTGSKSTGKSWVVSKVMQPLMGRNLLFVQSATTEAGIRQTLKADALPVLFDEAEGNTERSRANIQRVLELARQASSSDGGVIAKGTTSGDAMDFLVRSCFCFSSIIDGVVQASDRSRITQIEVNKKRYGSAEQYMELVKAKAYLTPETCAAFYWRIVAMADTIKHNAAVLADIIGNIVNDSRAGEQLGALIAGYTALDHTRKLTHTEAVNMCIALDDLPDYTAQYAEQDDAVACLDAMMSYHIEHGDKRSTIGALCARAYAATIYDEEDFKTINKSLAVYGFRVMDDKRLAVANKNERLKQLLGATPYSVGWDKVLARLPDSIRSAKPLSFFTYMQRSVIIDISGRFAD